MSASAKAIAERFVNARRSATVLPEYPGSAPETLEAAYRIQDEAIALDARPVLGWKVGRIMPPLDDQYGADRLAGPIFTVTDAAAGNSMPVFADGFAAGEAEFLLRVGKRPPHGKVDFTLAEAKALLDAVHLGIEVASSPFPGINDHGPGVTVSDCGNNYGLLIGEAVSNWQDDAFADWDVVSYRNGEEVGRAKASAMPDGPIGAARFLFSLLARRGIAIEPGLWISSGAVTGVHPVSVGDSFSARFDGHDPLDCTFVAAQGEG
ncbi:2-keto-4-pentenoate hydratase [Stakelama saccharophila]|uniref:2-keto-4-pentenoate hydratase n=1 Tax=Stakelama saccharophila TaxID=3075605 RepID=A0ABZ0BBK5_9SPHN|nr:2-keto-4-pentenoate hydratase [Stakelama sp. W311]WNO54815.1 2-keto-4-pentenoate hydratase [Stakelama sp. W311]